jgi:ankyrin repeat protein
MVRLSVLLALAAALYGQSVPRVAEGEVRLAVRKPLELMQKTSVTWFGKYSCSTCHNQILPMFAFDLARRRGVSLNQDALGNMQHKTFDFFADIDRAVQGSNIGESANSEYRLAFAASLGMPQSATTGVYARLIARRQSDDGRWVNDDERPPQASSDFSTTAYSVRTLQQFLPGTMEIERKFRVKRADMWLEKTLPRDTEDRVFQLFGLSWAGRSARDLTKFRDGLLALERSDGGWGQMPGRKSDAYATGEVLAVLHQVAGLGVESGAYQKGLRYLLSTQKADGTWFVESRGHAPAPLSPPYVESGWPYGHDQYISAMGTSWAVSALLLALPELPGAPLPLTWTSMQPKAVPDWATSVLFGDTATVRKLLDSGWDPNSATPNGTTALMMAAPDFEKTTLLLASGAAVNARAAGTRITALMVAASHRASDSVHLLLQHDAEAQPAKSEPAAFGATALFLAAYSGDVRAAKELRAKGGDLNARMLLFGIGAESPLSVAVERGEPAMIEALIHAGASANLIDPENGLNILSVAIFRNDVETARLLIREGADVNHRDKLGFTPLHWAANVDFGDTRVLELLLRAGADPRARNSQGLTPLQLAMRYGHSRHQQTLQNAVAGRTR